MITRRDTDLCTGSLTTRNSRCTSTISQPQPIAQARTQGKGGSISPRISWFPTMTLETFKCPTTLKWRYPCSLFSENRCLRASQFSRRSENSKSALSATKSWQIGIPSTSTNSMQSWTRMRREKRKSSSPYRQPSTRFAVCAKPIIRTISRTSSLWHTCHVSSQMIFTLILTNWFFKWTKNSNQNQLLETIIRLIQTKRWLR